MRSCAAAGAAAGFPGTRSRDRGRTGGATRAGLCRRHLRGAGETDALLRAGSQLGDWEETGAGNRRCRAARAAARRHYRAGAFAGIAQDARYALRFLRRNPAFTAIALATLAFGIGGNTAIFTMVDALVLRDLPYRDPGRLMAIETRRVDQPEIEPWTSAADFFDFRERQHSFSSSGGVQPDVERRADRAGAAEQLDALYMTAKFFPMLGVTAALGRTFTAEEDRRAGRATWWFFPMGSGSAASAATASAIGQSLRLDGGSLHRDRRTAGAIPLGGRAGQRHRYRYRGLAAHGREPTGGLGALGALLEGGGGAAARGDAGAGAARRSAA